MFPMLRAARTVLGSLAPALACVVGVLVATSSSPAAADRPNFVLIIADDLGWEDSGPYGNRGVRTPSLDRLAAGGLLFHNAVLTCSSCSPSRSSIITCRYPHNTGAEQLHWPLPKEQTTFVELLKAAGYWTAAVGKWHLGPAIEDRFDVVVQAKRDNPSGCGDWVPTLAGRPKDKPFFLWLAAFDPHRDYPPGATDRPHRPEDVTVPPYLPDTPEVRADLARYYDEITRLDGFVGQVLDELDRQGVADNTVVLFMTDNGRPFPRCKTTVYDSGVKTPLIVRWPAKIKPGNTTQSLVSSIDIGVTLLALAGVRPAESMQGQSFAAVLADPSAKVPRLCLLRAQLARLRSPQPQCPYATFQIHSQRICRFAQHAAGRCGALAHVPNHAQAARCRSAQAGANDVLQ